MEGKEEEEEKMRQGRERLLRRVVEQATENAEASGSKDDEISNNKSKNELEDDDLKRKIERILVWEVQDDKHESLQEIERYVGLMAKILSNVLNNPLDRKYRKMRLHNAAVQSLLGGYKTKDSSQSGCTKLMELCGWRIVLEEHEKVYTYVHEVDSSEWKVMEYVRGRLEKELEEIQEKSKKAGAGQKKLGLEQERAQILSALREDQEERRLKFRYT
eukprot:jgi/Picsp_1/6466/NSC_03812-R1_hypothetical protein CHLNCDRAFT_145228 [Chlorella variabilis]